ncbi:MAG: hypothetical protein EOP09_05395 [Proteobacteria bacterium]|nr:MAG: hypothetical protein EOP09_05395 [Pseudomonadota bacterium]
MSFKFRRLKLGVLEDPAVISLVCSLLFAACGDKQGYDQGTALEETVLGGGGASRTNGAPTVATTPTVVTVRAAPNYNIVNVTQIIPATSGLPDFTTPMLPFTGAPVAIGSPVLNAQTPFHFNYDFPQNNYQFVEAHLVIDTARDSSDTEGIFVDGIFTGRPPLANVNNASTETLEKLFFGNGGPTTNTFYIDYSLAHYKVATRNSFDLLLSDLLQGSQKNSIEVLKDNRLNVVTGDDSPVYQAYLVIRGRTISDSSLSCAQSPTYTFTNRYIHNDGNTVGGSAFTTGPIGNPRQSWQTNINPFGTYKAIEFYFDAPLPKVAIENINVTNANILMTVKRNGSLASTPPKPSAIIVNGVGVAEPGFDKTLASSVVETWYDAGSTAFQTFLSTIPTTSASTDVTLNLVNILGAGNVRSLLQQGKLNISFAGPFVISATGLTSARGFSAPINGPELELAGTYSTEVCEVPNNPDSVLTQEGVRVIEPEVTVEAGSSEVLNDGAGPAIASLQATEIGSTKATILWLTDEPSTSVVQYGVGNTAQTAQSSDLTTFHQIQLTGLSPYKYYDFKVTSTDKFGNASTSNVQVFVTLR